ncbi:MAG: hypothetical protein ACM4D3_24705 [Candidatus Sericytochromatia bacterium]
MTDALTVLAEELLIATDEELDDAAAALGLTGDDLSPDDMARVLAEARRRRLAEERERRVGLTVTDPGGHCGTKTLLELGAVLPPQSPEEPPSSLIRCSLCSGLAEVSANAFCVCPEARLVERFACRRCADAVAPGFLDAAVEYEGAIRDRRAFDDIRRAFDAMWEVAPPLLQVLGYDEETALTAGWLRVISWDTPFLPWEGTQ